MLIFGLNCSNMKLNPKPSLYAIASAAVVLNFTSCGDYEDGPAFTLKSKNKRLIGEWNVTKLADEKLDDEFVVELEFEDGGDLNIHWEYTFTYYGYSYTYDYDQTGDWDWGDGKKSLELDFGGDTYEYDITRLTSDELWMVNDDDEEWELEKI